MLFLIHGFMINSLILIKSWLTHLECSDNVPGVMCKCERMTPEQVGGVSHAGGVYFIETRKCSHTHPRMEETLVCYAYKLWFQT